MIKVIPAALLIAMVVNTNARAFEAEPTTLNTADIVGSMTLDRSCLNYCITGICVWLHCSITGCSIETSLRVRHYNPDLVVSVFDKPGDNPWQEARALYGGLENRLADSLVGLFHDVSAGGGQKGRVMLKRLPSLKRHWLL